ncbi:chemotaxis response regulator protein-glutamate methylesterase [Burkholderia ubonensis]|nr:chemotaxis response regulator protein-glutamate methylesterase [Burkholderia ubonensis]
MRSILKKLIDSHDDMRCVGAAWGAQMAAQMLDELEPDVITLDVEMPGMNGLEFLERMMRVRPKPTIMISSRTAAGSDAAIRAMELGAVDAIAKPVSGDAEVIADYAADLAELIRAAAAAKRTRLISPSSRSVTRNPVGVKIPGAVTGQTSKVIAVGSSTGGTEALKQILRDMPSACPPILIAQHMPESFTTAFATRLDAACRVRVKEAVHGEPLRYGCAYVAPGHSHLTLGARANQYICALERTPPVNRHRPSVDVLFESVARHAGRRAIGVMLTGMGKDGAAGMLRMREAGALNLAQDEKSCVVFGMPKEAIALGAVDEVIDLDAMAARLINAARRR